MRTLCRHVYTHWTWYRMCHDNGEWHENNNARPQTKVIEKYDAAATAFEWWCLLFFSCFVFHFRFVPFVVWINVTVCMCVELPYIVNAKYIKWKMDKQNEKKRRNSNNNNRRNSKGPFQNNQMALYVYIYCCSQVHRFKNSNDEHLKYEKTIEIECVVIWSWKFLIRTINHRFKKQNNNERLTQYGMWVTHLSRLWTISILIEMF